MRLTFAAIFVLLLNATCTQNSTIELKEFEEIHCTIENLEAATGDSLMVRITDGEYSRPMLVRFEDLKELIVNDRVATEIPKTISKLKNVEFLCLSWGKYTDVPKEMSKLPRLKNLLLLSTSIRELPIEIYEMKILKDLSVMYNNDFNFQKELCDINFQISLTDSGTKTNIPKCLTETGKVKLIKSRNN